MAGSDDPRPLATSPSADERRPLLEQSPVPISQDAAEGSNGNYGTTDADIPPGNDIGDVPLADELGTRALITALGSIWVGCFLAALDQTLVATLAVPISADFQSSKSVSWIASSYILTNSTFQPLYGRLTDIFSRKTGLIFCNVVFAIGNLICGIAGTQWVLLLGRAIAGIGGGGLTVISTLAASDLVPLRRRGLWQGLGNIVFSLGTGLGGLFGGVLNDWLGWRWAFLIQVPLTIVSGLLVYFSSADIPVKETSKSRLARVDFLGAFALATFLALLLLGLNAGGNTVPWSHPLVLTTLPLSLVSFLVFIYIEDRIASEPIIPVRLLLKRTVASACLVCLFSSMSVFATIFFGPLYYQSRGMTATRAGTMMIPLSLGASIGSLGAGILMRLTGKYWWLTLLLGATGVLGASLKVPLLNSDTPTGVPLPFFFLDGVAYAGMLTTTLLALIAAVDHKYQAVITSASYGFRSPGATIGISVASVVFQNMLRSLLWERLDGREGAADVIARVRVSIGEVAKLGPEWRADVVECYMGALKGVWGVTVVLSVLALVTAAFMREHVLYSNLARDQR